MVPFGSAHLLQDVFRRVSLGAPAEGLEPRPQHHAGAGSDLLEPVHGNADEMLRSVARGLRSRPSQRSAKGRSWAKSRQQCLAILVMSWPVWLRSTWRCHAMMPKTSSETSTPMGCKLRIGAIQEIGNHVIAMQLWGLSGRQTARLPGCPRQGSGHNQTGFRPRRTWLRIWPGQCCNPGLLYWSCLTRPACHFRATAGAGFWICTASCAMVLGDIVIPEKRLPCDYVHIQRMQETHVLGQIGDRMILDLFAPADDQTEC